MRLRATRLSAIGFERAKSRIPVNAILFNGEPLLFNGEFIIYTL